MFRFLRAGRACALAGALLAAGPAAGQTVEKVVDLTFYGTDDGSGVGGYAPLDRFVQVGSNLWFTTSKGGTFDAGTISRLDLTSTTVVQVASFDNTTGKAAEGSLLVIGEEAYFTTVNGGAGNKGTIAKVNLTNGAITVLHDFVTNGIPTGATPRGGLMRIGNELWGMTSLGGASNRGALIRYNLSTSNTTLAANFDGPVNGGQPYDNLVQVGDAWYFTTFTGGRTFGAPGLSLGAGTLSRLTFDASTNPVITRLIDLPAGHMQFPANTPVPVGTNTLYFTTVGPNGNPGAIVRYDIDTGFWTNVFNFVTNVPNPALHGRQPGYNGLTAWQGDLYFMTRQGGASNQGMIARFNTASNTVTKLADLTGTNGLALGSASGSYNTGTLVEWNDRFYCYYPVPAGGSSNRGTIVRIALPPPPVELATLSAGTPGTTDLAWGGGYPPFTIQQAVDLTAGTWTAIATNVPTRNATVSTAADAALFRILGSP